MATRDQRSEEMRLRWERDRATDIEDANDEIKALAEEVYADYEATERQRLKGQQQAGALVGLGYGDWVLPGDSYLDPDTERRRQKILMNLAQKPYGPKLFQIGLAGHPRRKAERKVDYLKFYLRIEGDAIHWGLAESKGREALMEAKFGRVELRVLEGKEALAELTSEEFDNTASMAELGLDDDDYRFQVGARNSDGWGYTGEWFDMALEDGAWTQLENQGHGWDGETEGSTRRHSGGPARDGCEDARLDAGGEGGVDTAGSDPAGGAGVGAPGAPEAPAAPGTPLEMAIAAAAAEEPPGEPDELQQVLEEVAAARKAAKADIASSLAAAAAASELRRQADEADRLAAAAVRRAEPGRQVLRDRASQLLGLLKADEDFPGIG